jgi:hypothetical protein
MKNNIYMVTYVIMNKGKYTPGNMCCDMNVKNVSVLDEIINDIKERSTVKGDIWITNISKF